MADWGRVRLRAVEPADIDELYDIENDMELWNVGAANTPFSRHSIEQYVMSAGDIYSDKQARWMVEDSSGAVVGVADLANFSPRHSRAEVGIVIKKAHRGRGYAKQAVGRLAFYASESLCIRQLYAVVDKANQPAMALFRSAGFKETAVLDDWLSTPAGFSPVALFQLIFRRQ